MQDLNKYIKKGSLVIFNATAIVTSLGYFLDISNFKDLSDILITNNIVSIVFTMVPLLLYHLKVFNFKVSFSIIIYTLLANVNVDTFSDFTMPYRIELFLRDSLFILLMLTLAALTVNKMHALIIAFIYMVSSLIFSFMIKNEFLNSSIALMLFIISAYSVVIYYFVNVLEKAILDREKNQSIIYDQNKLLNETNSQLEERQQLVEEQSEELISQRDKLKELNVTKDKLFSIIAHDLKNPFGPLLGNLDMLVDNNSSWTQEESQKMISYVHASGHKIYDLLDDLLQWSYSQRKGTPFSPVKTYLQDIVLKVFSLLQEAAEKKEHTLSFSLVPEDIMIEADTNMLCTTLRNIVFNSIKFTPRGGSIKLHAYVENKMVILTVSDNGIGMNEKTVDNLFEISSLQSTQGTEEEKGTGLGLIVTNEFVIKHGGKIWVESELGKGSVFTVQLPQLQKDRPT